MGANILDKYETVLLPCTVYRGMFSDEYGVEITLSSGFVVSLFAEEGDVVNIDLPNQTGYLKVKLLEHQPREGEELIWLPKESLEYGNHWLEIPAERLVHLDEVPTRTINSTTDAASEFAEKLQAKPRYYWEVAAVKNPDPTILKISDKPV